MPGAHRRARIAGELVARQGGGYAVELPGGRFVAVEPGLYADDYVEVSGSGLREGMQVVTAE